MMLIQNWLLPTFNDVIYYFISHKRPVAHLSCLFIIHLGQPVWKGWTKVGQMKVPTDMVNNSLPAAVGLIKHPVRELVETTLIYSPQERPSIEEVIKKIGEVQRQL